MRHLHMQKLAHPKLPPTTAETWLSNTCQHHPHDDSKQRDYFIDQYGYAILNRPTIELLRDYSPILEIGAGTGYWAYELQKHGVRTVPTDPHPEQLWPTCEPWTHIYRLNGTAAITRFPTCNLLLSWPETEPWAAKVVKRFKGNFLIYIGEPKAGSTGADEMFEAIQADYSVHLHHTIPTFSESQDSLTIYRRR